ncbi:dTDP-4-dehydrorhamnose reductase [Sphingomonas sp. NSE70-1]|uniref:dTDP-4-dehydrorhamnose reductase n=1 Tax=Sphingomonas caseinilyticus TaxID=2908205 RepID=A0ABT0RQS5_9SPHN|nr:dTDP-4-dehydrorhamnose reductase [Sphingomonas caseinilyticus]MCL6697316.1 dTDP-4-dehydrorhamnose reductase [Sphingomonas caseinilyticus]
MRIVATGRDGQVVTSLRERAEAAGHELIALGRPELDLAGNSAAIIRAIVEARPDVVISAAAYTAVDKAESEPALARAVNVQGPTAVAEAARLLDVPLLHLSTDYVFDGTKPSPYCESDPTNPAGVYGQTKRDGEEAVLSAHDNVAILRTAWVYSPFGSNFVRTMLRLAADREEVGVVADQFGNPTSALDIADGLLAVAHNLRASANPAMRGIFHMAGCGSASWADFATAIFEASASARGPTARVRPIETKDYPTPARRPSNSQLDCTKLDRLHGVRLPDWRGSTEGVVIRLVAPAGQTQGSLIR